MRTAAMRWIQSCELRSQPSVEQTNIRPSAPSKMHLVNTSHIWCVPIQNFTFDPDVVLRIFWYHENRGDAVDSEL